MDEHLNEDYVEESRGDEKGLPNNIQIIIKEFYGVLPLLDLSVKRDKECLITKVYNI